MPLYALVVVVSVVLIFILCGEINTLAPIVTMPFLITYACIDYAYFALAQSFDIQHHREQRYHKTRNSTVVDYAESSPSQDISDLDNLFPERTQYNAIKVTKILKK